jgi:hypothetical protein
LLFNFVKPRVGSLELENPENRADAEDPREVGCWEKKTPVLFESAPEIGKVVSAFSLNTSRVVGAGATINGDCASGVVPSSSLLDNKAPGNIVKTPSKG